MRNTRLMRVPNKFHDQVSKMAKKYNYPSKTSFLEKEGIVILENVDTINKYFKPVFGLFKKGGHMNVKNIKK